MKHFGPIFSALSFCVCLAAPAQAVTITIERMSDTVGNITGTGSLPTTGVPSTSSDHIISFGDLSDDVFGTDPAPGSPDYLLNTVSSTMEIGLPIGYSYTYNGMFNGGPSSAPIFYIANLAGDTLSGSIVGQLQATLASGTWASVGTSGALYWGTSFSNDNVNVGSWEIVAPVPIPAALPLLIAALGGLGFAARRRKSI